MVSAAIIFAFYGKAPADALYVYFVKPLTGCGTATLTVNGRDDNIVLDRCGSI